MRVTRRWFRQIVNVGATLPEIPTGETRFVDLRGDREEAVAEAELGEAGAKCAMTAGSR